MSGVFARDAQGNIKTKQPCGEPGCDHPNWHVCPKRMGPDTTAQVLVEQQKRKPKTSAAHLKQLNDGRSARWERYREETRARDQKIVARYKAGDLGMSKIAGEFGLSYQTVRRVVMEAAERGEVTVRAPGTTVQNGAV